VSTEEPKTPVVPGRQVLLLAVLAVAGSALFYGGLAQLPKRFLYTEAPVPEAVVAQHTPTPAASNATPDWLQDPLAVCAECHTPKDAEQFRKIITPLMAAQSSAYWIATAPAPGVSFAPMSMPETAVPQTPPAQDSGNAALAESR
jgi:cytochrome c553